MTKIAEWVIHCSHCDAPAFESAPLPEPKAGDALAWQHWRHIGGTQTKLGDPFICVTCCKWFQPIVQCMTMKRYIGAIQ